jgi:hypothetical protein
MKAPVCLDAEVRKVPGTNLAVSAAGEVFGPRGRRKVQPREGGYLAVTFRRPGQALPAKLSVHHAVLLAWVGPRPEGMEGRHIDGDITNNAASNLAWSTHVENIADKEAHGTMLRGAGVGTSKLTEADVLAMRRLYPALSRSALAKRFGVGKSTVHDAVTGRRWSHLTREEG